MPSSKRSNVIGTLADMDQASQDVYESLRLKLTSTDTLAELTAAVDDAFKAEVARLPEVAQRALRDQYSVWRDEVKHKVKMEALADKPVTINDPPDFPPASPRFPNSVFCVIKGTIDGTDERFECVSGAVRIVRHFQDSRTDSYPQHLTFYRESTAAMKARNAKPDTTPMWLVKKMPTPRASSDGIPF